MLIKLQKEVRLFQDLVCSELITFDIYLYYNNICNHFQVHKVRLQAAFICGSQGDYELQLKMKSLRLREV